MASSTSGARRLFVLGLAVAAAPGCVTGHLLDEARRFERPVAVHAAAIAAGRLVLDYTAEVTTDVGATRGRERRRAAIRLADLDRADLPVTTLPVERLGPGPLPGTPVAVRVASDAAGRPERLVLDGHPPLWTAALTRRRIAPWAWPLLPLALAWDVLTTPALLFFAPAVIAVGD